ncbi:unnamed protein product [Cuscuta campestris]|uniref:Uncharacterized protein n=1 Tax=Cuscuta campestris TaxID=132261 RepID=A0A484NQ68_9ASTE|nr:unnamed protein product [Cuscuta campestris]
MGAIQTFRWIFPKKGLCVTTDVAISNDRMAAAAIIRQRNGNFIGAWTKISQGETDPEEGEDCTAHHYSIAYCHIRVHCGVSSLPFEDLNG